MTNTTISREQDYYGFEAEAVAKYGTMQEAWDVKYAFDCTLNLANVALTAAIAGVKIDAKLAPSTFTVDNGIKLQYWTGIFDNASFSANAELKKSGVALSDMKTALAAIQLTTTSLSADLAKARQRVIGIKTGIEVSV
jgi:hypothetical protein